MHKLSESEEALFSKIVTLKKKAVEKQNESLSDYREGLWSGRVHAYSDVLRLLTDPDSYTDIVEEYNY